MYNKTIWLIVKLLVTQEATLPDRRITDYSNDYRHNYVTCTSCSQCFQIQFRGSPCQNEADGHEQKQSISPHLIFLNFK